MSKSLWLPLLTVGTLDRIPLHTIWGYVLVCESVVMGCVCVEGGGKERLGWKTLSFMAVPCANFSDTSGLTVTLLLLVGERVYR